MNDESLLARHASFSFSMTALLVVRLSALGDVIHAIPAVMKLRGSFDVRWAVEAPYRELVEIVTGATAVPVRMKRWGRTPLASRREMADARRRLRGCEIAVDFQGLIKSSALAWLSGAPERYGFDQDAIRERAAGVFLNRRVGIDRHRHVIDWNLQLAEAVLARSGSGPVQSVAPDWRRFPADSTGRLEQLRGTIVLLPGAGRPEKQWPASRFRQIAERFGERAVVVWGPGELELAQAIGGQLAPATDLRELAFILNASAVVVGGDTGPLHLAAALGRPVVGLYGPTDPRRNGPYGQLHRVIDQYRASGRMDAISNEEVVAAVERVVAC